VRLALGERRADGSGVSLIVSFPEDSWEPNRITGKSNGVSPTLLFYLFERSLGETMR
jgi:hypothetical protein